MEISTVFVVGGTGNQGGGVARALCGDPRFRVKCLTRRSRDSSPAVAALARLGAEIVVGSLDDPSTYRAALSACDAAFLNTTHDIMRGGPEAEARETSQGIAFIDTAVAAGVPFIVYSTLPDFPGNHESAPKVKVVAHLQRVCSQGQASATSFALIVPTFYYEDYISVWPPTPSLGGGPLHFWMLPHPQADTKIMAHVCMDDFGGIVRGILAEGPGKHHARRFVAVSQARPLGDYLHALGTVMGRPVRFSPLSLQQFRRLPFPPGLKTSLEQYADPNQGNSPLAAWLLADDAPVNAPSENTPADVHWEQHIAECRRLHPGLQTFETWAAAHTDELRAFHPIKPMLAWMARYAIAREALSRFGRRK